MFETSIVLLLAAGLWGIDLATNVAPEVLLIAGMWVVSAGFLLGLPTGALYHLYLYRSLRRVDALPARWWLRPTSLHDLIPRDDRLRVLGWCYLGAAGFLVIVAGLAIIAAGAFRMV